MWDACVTVPILHGGSVEGGEGWSDDNYPSSVSRGNTANDPALMWWQQSEAGHHLIWYITCHVSRGTRYHTRWLWMGWCNVQCSVTRPPRWPMLSRVRMCHGSWQRDMGTTVFSWPGEVSRTLIHSYPPPPRSWPLSAGVPCHETKEN